MKIGSVFVVIELTREYGNFLRANGGMDLPTYEVHLGSFPKIVTYRIPVKRAEFGRNEWSAVKDELE